MTERPCLDKDIEAKEFRSFYYRFSERESPLSLDMG